MNAVEFAYIEAAAFLEAVAMGTERMKHIKKFEADMSTDKKK